MWNFPEGKGICIESLIILFINTGCMRYEAETCVLPWSALSQRGWEQRSATFFKIFPGYFSFFRREALRFSFPPLPLAI